MEKEFLNFLRWITSGEFPDSVLEKSTNHRIENGKLKFDCELQVNIKSWTCGFGTSIKKGK